MSLGASAFPVSAQLAISASNPHQSQLVGIVWLIKSPQLYRRRAGDVIQFDNRLCRVLRVNDCAAVVLMNRPVRTFKTRFDKPVRFYPPPAMFRISPNAEAEILNRKTL